MGKCFNNSLFFSSKLFHSTTGIQQSAGRKQIKNNAFCKLVVQNNNLIFDTEIKYCVLYCARDNKKKSRFGHIFVGVQRRKLTLQKNIYPDIYSESTKI